MTYGLVRSVTYDYHHTTKYGNMKIEQYELKEMLRVDKITRVFGQSCLALFAWPGMMVEDLFRLGYAVRGKDWNEYK